jgi:hypothetical protein
VVGKRSWVSLSLYQIIALRQTLYTEKQGRKKDTLANREKKITGATASGERKGSRSTSGLQRNWCDRLPMIAIAEHPVRRRQASGPREHGRGQHKKKRNAWNWPFLNWKRSERRNQARKRRKPG